VPFVTKIKDGQEHTEYFNDDVNDTTYAAVLKQCHLLFKLFNGQLLKIADNPAMVKALLEKFYSRVYF
jgi:hypothetical protein